MKTTLLYIATPYTSLEYPAQTVAATEVAEQRYRWASEIIGKIFDKAPNFVPLSMIAYTHPLLEYVETDVNWYQQDLKVLEVCDMVLVVEMPGWDKSYGVGLEIGTAMRLDIPVIYATPENVIEVLNETIST